MLFALILSLFAVNSVFADLSAKICTKELEGVVYVPSSCAYTYLKSINELLRVQAPLLWGSPSQARSVFSNFQIKYFVDVYVIDAF